MTIKDIKDMSATKLSNVGRVKEAVAGSMLKHPWKWGGAVVGLGLAKFALAGWAIGKVTKKKKTSGGTKYKTTHLSPGGKYDYKITSYRKQPKKYMTG